jgi:hypothetical protein
MKKIIIFFVLLFLLTFQAVAAELIQPFGDLTWEDGISDVLMKINNINGIETMNLIIDPPDQISVKGITTKNRLEKQLNLVCNATEPGTTFYKVPLLSDNQLSLENYKELGKKILRSAPFIIEAFPIMVANMPFKIYISFDNSVGLMIRSPEKAIMLNSPKHGKYYIPLVITQVALTSELLVSGRDLGANKDFVNLKGIVKEKYANSLSKKEYRDDKDSFKLQVKDKKGTAFKMLASIYSKKCNIIYQSMVYKKRLREIYNNYLSELRKDKHKGKKDMSSGL